MKINITIKNKQYYKLVILFILFAIAGCKKAEVQNAEEEIISPTTGTRFEFTIDSIYLYAKQVYLWNDALPNYNTFRPREKYSNAQSAISAFRNELFDISQFKINQVTGKPFEISNYSNVPKYSYLQPRRSTGGGARAGMIDKTAVLASSIIHSDNKVIAYLALASFPALSSVKSELDRVFDEMVTHQPRYLILDLRTNSGGYIETAEYAANLVVPSTLNGKIMYSEQFNPTLQNSRATILRNQLYLDEMGETVVYNGHLATLADVDYTETGNTYRFNKKGGLESIQDIYVIVSGQTASASELLISCLKPYFNVKLIGERSYGKPVGFFGINIDQYSVYLSSFLIKNAQGWSDYFNGMEPDLNITMPNNPILGDAEEVCLKSTIAAINGHIQLQPKKSANISKLKLSQVTALNGQSPVDMLENRLRLKR